MKRFAVCAILLFAMAVTSRADNFVSVQILPETGIGETLALTFTWDTTTNILSNLNINASGPWGPFSPTSFYTLFGVDNYGDTSGLSILSLNSLTATIEPVDYGVIPSRAIPPTPGTYVIGYFFDCDISDPTCPGNGPGDGASTAIVTAISPVTTPEPGTLALLGVGLLGLVLIKKL